VNKGGEEWPEASSQQEAECLRLSAETDAGGTSRRVGYLGASQFSREYSRLFSSAFTRDIARLRQETSHRAAPTAAADSLRKKPQTPELGGWQDSC